MLDTKPNKKIGKLLVTEDDKVLIRFYEQALEGVCQTLVVVGSSKEAINKLNTENYDFLITDLKLEENDGLDVVNCAIDNNPQIKILVASGYVTDSVYHDVMVNISQIKGYLQKPFTLDDLLAKIESIIAGGDNHPS